MKISKLFHWLYAILMLAPISAVGVTCLTHVFNKEVSEESETAVIEYMYETSNPQDSIITGYVYKINATTTYEVLGDYNDSIYSIELISGQINTYNNLYFDESTIEQYLENPKLSLKIDEGDIYYRVSIGPTDEGVVLYPLDNTNSVTFNNCIIRITDKDGFLENLPIQWLVSNLQEVPQDEIPIQGVNIETRSQDSTTNIFYDSVNQVQDSFILNWCGIENPITQVFAYMSGFFGMSTSHITNNLLTYWLSISIVWLVFDVFMYVFLLAHRWIDKAKIE